MLSVFDFLSGFLLIVFLFFEFVIVVLLDIFDFFMENVKVWLDIVDLVILVFCEDDILVVNFIFKLCVSKIKYNW